MAKEVVSKINVFDRLEIKSPDWMSYDAPLVDEAVAEGRRLQERNNKLEEENTYKKKERNLTVARWIGFGTALFIAGMYGIWGINWGLQDSEANKKILTYEVNYYKQIYKTGWEDGKAGFPNSLIDAKVEEVAKRLYNASH